ncbi:hypothetical protein [Thalassobacillus devorans]|uniref:hypothetical protein n=1 Tax=Thalassobacillus devorans TaxID=279813 RepID=UPI0007858030|nr:hypothetical protein [Thalassobacillus devorans]
MKMIPIGNNQHSLRVWTNWRYSIQVNPAGRRFMYEIKDIPPLTVKPKPNKKKNQYTISIPPACPFFVKYMSQMLVT